MGYEEIIPIDEVVYRANNGSSDGNYVAMLEQALAAVRSDGPKILARHMQGAQAPVWNDGAVAIDDVVLHLADNQLAIRSKGTVLFSIKKGLADAIKDACTSCQK